MWYLQDGKTLRYPQLRALLAGSLTFCKESTVFSGDTEPSCISIRGSYRMVSKLVVLVATGARHCRKV